MKLKIKVAVFTFFALGTVTPNKVSTAPFNPIVLKSVVSLMPDWPKGSPVYAARADTPKDPQGSAVAVFPGGYIATNMHVLGGAKTARIRLNDGRILKAQIIGKDTATDLALIKIDHDLPVLTHVKQVEIGNSVCAVGNQFGLGLSVTCGVVSAKARTGMGFNPIEDFIQTDAAINPGGSGGALVNQWGQLVGLVSAIFTKNGVSNIGVNFATSSALVYRVMEDLRDFGKVIRVNSGLSIQNLTMEQKQRYSGVEIMRVKYNSPTFIAELKPKDILIRIGQRYIQKPADVPSAFQFVRVGESVKIEFMRNHRLMLTTIKF
jgi:S1-C subfamily serine protease